MKAEGVVVDIGCGNSPRMALVRDLNIAFATGDHETNLGWLDDDVAWNLVGMTRLGGKAAVGPWLTEKASDLPTSMEIETILSHGKLASASGTLAWGDETWAMSGVYVIRSAAWIAQIDTFLIRLG